MEFNYNVTGERRKALVTTISEVLGMKAVYKGMHTAAYVIDSLTVTKEGTLIADEHTDDTTLNKVLASLADAGFTTETPDTADAEEPTGLVISMPMDGFSEVALDNLRKLVDSKTSVAVWAILICYWVSKVKSFCHISLYFSSKDGTFLPSNLCFAAFAKSTFQPAGSSISFSEANFSI